MDFSGVWVVRKFVVGMRGAHLGALDLPVFEFDEGIATEDADRDLDLAAFGVDLFHGARLVLERTIGDFDGFSDFKVHFRFHFLICSASLDEDIFDVFGGNGEGTIFVACKTDDASGVFNEIPGAGDELITFVEQMHVGNDVTRHQFPSRLGLFTALDFRNAFRGNDDLVNKVAHFVGFDAFVQVVCHFVLLTGEHLDSIPLIFRCDCHEN